MQLFCLICLFFASYLFRSKCQRFGWGYILFHNLQQQLSPIFLATSDTIPNRYPAAAIFLDLCVAQQKRASYDRPGDVPIAVLRNGGSTWTIERDPRCSPNLGEVQTWLQSSRVVVEVRCLVKPFQNNVRRSSIIFWGGSSMRHLLHTYM